MTKLGPDEELTREAYDKHGKAWAKRYEDDQFWTKEYKEYKHFLPGGRIVDIGCGAGRDAQELSKLGFEVVGTEISDTLLEICRYKLPKLTFHKQSVYELSFDKKFDGFWCTAVLLHVPKKRINEAFAGIKNVLKPGAVGFISVKNGEGEEIEEFEIEGKVLKRFYAYWTRTEFEKILTRHNCEVLKYRYRPVNTRQKWHCFFVKLK